MKNIASSLFVVIVFIMKTNAQSFKVIPGRYDYGVIGNDSTGKITIVINDGIGGYFDSPFRSCILYFEGTIDNMFLSEYDDRQKKILKNRYSLTKNSDGYVLSSDYVPNTGICNTSTFTKNNSGKYECSLHLTKERNLISVSYTFSKITKVHASNDLKSTVLKKLEKFDVVEILKQTDKWFEIQMTTGKGWVLKNDLFSSVYIPKSDPKISITTPKSFFYQDASEAKPKKSFLLKGDIAFVEETKGDWLFIRFEGKTITRGWMHKKNVQYLK